MTFLLVCFFVALSTANFVYPLPTNYEYFVGDGVKSGLNADRPYFELNGRNVTVLSGALHYFRVHPAYWRDRLRKIRAAGLNTVETYVPWNLHEPYSGVFDFGRGGSDFEEFLDIEKFLRLAQEEDLFVLVRAGPYICAEWEFGGMPSWLLNLPDLKLRSNDPVFLSYVDRYFDRLFSILVPLQFTEGGPIIAFQVENEYGNTWNIDPDYLRSLAKIFRTKGVTELLYTSDPLLDVGAQGALPGELLITANFNQNVKENLDKLDEFQSGKPKIAMEYWSGWFDHIAENHTENLVPVERYRRVYEDILSYPASVNIYVFIGGTNFGFTNGAGDNTYDLDNSGLVPSATSYDYDAPVSESGQLTEKWYATYELLDKYNPIKTRLPEVPESPPLTTFDDVKVEEQILLSELLDSFPLRIPSEGVLPMEKLPINNNSGQSFGYVAYRKTNLNLAAGAVLKISGYVRDHVLVLLNGKLLNPVLSRMDDLDKFGYWRLFDSEITLTREATENATLDLVVENEGRNNFGLLNQFQQYKGLINDVFIDNEVIKNWEIMPLEFGRSWNQRISGWHAAGNRESNPALYRVKFNATLPLRDTYVDVREWRKGVVIVNGFVLGRTFGVGPQQALYLPGPLLREGENVMVVFEHFSAPEYVKFSNGPIYGLGSYIENL